MDKEQFLEVYRHSLAHILAKAVIEIYGKDVQYAIGPQIEDGCYYDFLIPASVGEGDFKALFPFGLLQKEDMETISKTDKL